MARFKELKKFMNLYEKIKVLCEKQNMTVAQLERKLDISNGQIRRWKDGKYPTADRLKKVADYFDVSADSLLDEEDSKEELEENKDIRIMQRAAKNMSEEDRKKAIKMFEAVFDNWEDITRENNDK